MLQELKEKYINPYTDFDFKKRREYDDSIKAYRDINNAINTAKAEGRAEGRAEGLAEAKKEYARKMKADGMPYELISKYTTLSIDEIATL